MAKFDSRLLAHQYRRKGLSINKIAKMLSVAKSTASIWCKDIKLTKAQKNRLIKNAIKGGHYGRMMGAETNKQKRLTSIKDANDWAKKKLKNISDRDLFIAGIALYWAEGWKKGKGRFDFINSDSSMIKFMALWLEKIMGVSKNELCPRVAINEIHKPRINKVLRFWARLLGVPKSSLGNPVFIKIKLKKVYENHDSYYGVLRLKVVKGTILRYKMISLIEIMQSYSGAKTST